MSDTVILSGRMDSVDRFEQWGNDYAPHKRFPWLSNLLWAALEKLGCIHPHMGTVRQWRYASHVKNPRVLEAIHKAVDIEAVWRDPSKYVVVMGIEDYHELMGQERDNLPNAGFSFIAKPFGYRHEIFGIKVHVVTTLSGIAAIPRVLVEQPA